MGAKIKSRVQNLFGKNFYHKIGDLYKSILNLSFIKYMRNLKYLISNTSADLISYYKYSNVFRKTGLEKQEAELILNYHSIEKGMLYLNMKPRFAQQRVLNLRKILELEEVLQNNQRSQIKVTLQVLCKYYEIHKQKGYDIESYFPLKDYEKYKQLLNNNYTESFCGAINYNYQKLYKDTKSPFEKFAFARKSIRTFTGELIDKKTLNKAIELSLSAPSVCNRQANTVYLVEDKHQIDKILHIQGGFKGYEENVKQLLILTNNRNYYYTVGERNQFYVDGGVFLMNLLYSLYYYKIASCPANWGKMVKHEKALDKIIKIPNSEKIICLIPIGKATEEFRITLSKRREVKEMFKTL